MRFKSERSSESCGWYENPLVATPCRFESGPGHQVFHRHISRRRRARLAESVRQRLLNLARHKGEDFQITLNNYFLERFLYRLSRSTVHNRFVLKGALLLRLRAGPGGRIEITD